MFRAGLNIIAFATIVCLLVSFIACATGESVIGAGQVSIADILADPTGYEGKPVTVSGEYRGWESGHGSPPVTRSDWILKDETGAIYIVGPVSPGLDPAEDIGKKMTVYGMVKVKGNQAYIEAKVIR